ncbi:MAG: RtcB family protein [Myxococcales bacterium]|nr:RtcB family protein [Myxococcales bacterium]
MPLHRKGACPALGGDPGLAGSPFRYTGDPVIIPGSMGAASYLLAGTCNDAALCSACHGAGRSLSRGKSRHVDDRTYETTFEQLRVVTPIDPTAPEVRLRRDVSTSRFAEVRSSHHIGSSRWVRACTTKIPAAEIWWVMTAPVPAAARTVGASPHSPANRNTRTAVASVDASWMATSAGGSSNSCAIGGAIGVTNGLPYRFGRTVRATSRRYAARVATSRASSGRGSANTNARCRVAARTTPVRSSRASIGSLVPRG